MNTEDRRNVIELNRHLDTQGMSFEEEVELQKKVDAELKKLVDDAIADVHNSYFTDALLECANELRELMDCTVDEVDVDDPMKVLGAFVVQAKKLKNFTEAMKQELGKLYLDEAEENAR